MGIDPIHVAIHIASAIALGVAVSVIAKLLVERRRENEVARLLHIIDGRLVALAARVDRHGDTLEDIGDELEPPRDARGRFVKREEENA